MTIERAAPWLVSSVSGLYILARARHLSVSEASDVKLAQFLFRQSWAKALTIFCNSG